jgi:hypothetical protein
LLAAIQLPEKIITSSMHKVITTRELLAIKPGLAQLPTLLSVTRE